MYSNVVELQSALESKWCDIDDDVVKIIQAQGSTLIRQKVVVKLVTTSARQLGLEGRVCYGEMFVEGVNRGLQPCPTELAAQLRHQYSDQPENELLRVISLDRLINSREGMRIFTLSQLGQIPQLDVYTATHDIPIGLDDIYVWVRPDI